MLRSCFFFYNDTATTEIYTLSLHDALPILDRIDQELTDLPATRSQVYNGKFSLSSAVGSYQGLIDQLIGIRDSATQDRKSTRLNSSHANISYAVFCLKKNKTKAHDSTYVW